MCFQRSSERIEGKSRLPQSGWKIVPQSRTGCRETPVAGMWVRVPCSVGPSKVEAKFRTSDPRVKTRERREGLGEMYQGKFKLGSTNEPVVCIWWSATAWYGGAKANKIERQQTLRPNDMWDGLIIEQRSRTSKKAVFTTLHGTQTRSSDENSVCLFVCQTRAL